MSAVMPLKRSMSRFDIHPNSYYSLRNFAAPAPFWDFLRPLTLSQRKDGNLFRCLIFKKPKVLGRLRSTPHKRCLFLSRVEISVLRSFISRYFSSDYPNLSNFTSFLVQAT